MYIELERSNKRKRLYTKKGRSRLYPEETIIDADYADDLALLVTTPAQANSLMNGLDQTTLAST